MLRDSACCNLTSTVDTEPLNPGRVHVWSGWLNRDASSVNVLFEILSPDEQHKVNSYRFDADRNRFVVVRGMLRKILCGYLACGPGQVHFSYNQYGKPFLAQQPYRFNVTHSGGLALVAVTGGQEVGIDAEFIDESFEIMKIARSVFSETEMVELQELEPHERTSTFFRHWTRNEAYLKALGTGFSNSVKPYERDAGWNLIDLSIDQNYRAAMAIEGKVDGIKYFRIGAE